MASTQIDWLASTWLHSTLPTDLRAVRTQLAEWRAKVQPNRTIHPKASFGRFMIHRAIEVAVSGVRTFFETDQWVS